MHEKLKDARSHLPLTDLSYQILLSLAARPLHGYGVLKSIADRTDDGSAPATGTLYTAIRRLCDDGLLVPSEEPTSARRGRAYRLTGLGGTVLRLESRRLAGLVREARARHLIDSPAEEGP